MKNNKRLLGIIAISALIMVSMVFVSCGGSSAISGTYTYDRNHSLTFAGNKATGIVGGNEMSGTFTVNNDRLVIKFDGWDYHFTIIDSKTIRDSANDTWTKN